VSNKGRHWRKIIFGLGTAIALTAAAQTNVAGGGGSGPPVTLQDHTDSDSVVLENGIVRATITKSTGQVTSLQFHSVEVLANEQHKSRLYYELNASGGLEVPSQSVYSVTQRSPDFVDVSFKTTYQPGAPTNPVDIDIHYALGRGNAGLYSYSIMEHKPTYPDFGLGLWHVIMRMAHDDKNFLLERVYTNAQKIDQIPSVADYSVATDMPIKEIYQIHTGVQAGKYDCKYDSSAIYADLNCWGFSSNVHNLGVWFVVGSHEFFNNGPAMYELNAAEGVNLILLNGVHYGTQNPTIPKGEEWRKIYGPFLIYFSEKKGGDANWADAQAQGLAEAAAWPYAWLDNPDYPLAAARGSVTGRFVPQDVLKPSVSGAHAWVGLARPEVPEGNWQFQAKDYQYWVRASTDGNFTIPNVRPGNYTLYAFTDGAVGEFSQANVTVAAGHATPLGNMTWRVPHHGSSIAWEIGVPDRSAGEFRYGQIYHKGYIWDKFPKELPNPLEFTIGVSNATTDWNYAQTRYVGADGNITPWKWRINFNLATVPASGNATLTLAFASADHAHLYIYVNNEDKLFTQLYPEFSGGDALLREGVRARYCVSYVPIPVERLHPGKNTITLMMASTQNERDHVMYDYLNLEMPPAAPLPPQSGHTP
jgi:rhamnogalacturonan endolyase